MPQKISVLFVIDYFKTPNAGTESQMIQLIDNLDKEKFSPQLLVFEMSDALNRYEFPCNVSVLGMKSISSPMLWVKLLQFARRFRRAGGQLAHIYFNDASVICPPLFKLVGVKTIISRRDMGFWYTNTYRRLLRVTGKCVSGMIANSEAVRDVTEQVERLPRAKTHVIYNGYETCKQFEPEAIKELARLKDAGRLIVGLVANIRPIKRIYDAITALSLLFDSQGTRSVDFVVIGGGDPSDLRALASDLGVGNHVHFLGPRSDVNNCLHYLDIALLCSESEGFSNAIVEYMRAGLPVICTATGGNPEAVIHEQTGLLYEVADTADLAVQLQKLIDNAELRGALGSAGQKFAREHFSVERMVREHQSIYLKISE